MKFPQKIDLSGCDKGRKIWFMSDLHYNHVNILKLNGRNFKDISDMNSYLLQEIREKVGKRDILFDLGDMTWKETGQVIKEFKKILPDRSYKVVGNHDMKNREAWGYIWKVEADLLDVQIKNIDGEEIQIVLSHYPLLDWNHRYRGSWNIHGHTHGHVDKINRESGELRVDVGFDGELAKEIGSFLVPFDKILEVMKEKTGGKNFRVWANEKDSTKKYKE